MARQQAETGDIPGAQHALALVTKLDINPTGITQQSIPLVARALVRTAGPSVDLSWIAKLAAPEDKARAYAAAAAGLFEPVSEK